MNKNQVHNLARQQKSHLTTHACNRAAGISSSDVSNKLQSALELHQKGHIDQAEALYQEILQSHPKNFDALQLLATVALQKKNHNQAITLFQKGFKLNNQHPGSYNNYGIALQNVKRYREALISYDKALILNPQYQEAYFNRGIVLYNLKRYNEALDSYDKVIDLNPDYPNVRSNRACAQNELNRQTVSKTVLIKPSAPTVLLVTFQWSTLIEMPYLIKQAGCHVDLLCPDNNWCKINSFYDNWIDSGNSLESLISSLIKLRHNNNYKYILIGDDPILWKIYLDKIFDLWDILPIRNKSAISMLSKIGLAERCKILAIKSPEFKIIDDKTTSFEALEYLGLPIVIKDNYSNGGSGVRVFRDLSAYNTFIDNCEFSEPLLAQQFIDGHHIGIEALFKNGHLLQFVTSIELDIATGPATKRRYIPNNEIIRNIISKLGENALLHGFMNISFMQEKLTQNFFLFETDPRPNKWVPYARWFGQDFSKAFKIFIADSDKGIDYRVFDHVSFSEGYCMEVEYFPDHAIKLINSGRIKEALLHLLDFDKNLRYMTYDPVLLEKKMKYFHNGCIDAKF